MEPVSDQEMHASGFIEGRTYQVSSEVGGVVEALLVEEGDSVSAGQVILRLASASLEAARDQAEAGVTAAQAALEAVNELPREVEVSVAEAYVAKSEAKLISAQASLDMLYVVYDPLDPPDMELHAAQALVVLARAEVKLAEARLAQVKADPRAEEIEVVQAQWDEAEANLRLVELQIERLTLTAPVDGVIGQVLINFGEVAIPGVPLIQVIDLSQLILTIYVPVSQVALISLGDEVIVTVDAYPEKIFKGIVYRIADQAQFTPTNVQTQEERVKLVFAVEVLLEEASGLLKPGMPADALIVP
ncbi:MAG: efflux RND transporter periplasmic adaptor subunit [Chloroflexota bacterium]